MPKQAGICDVCKEKMEKRKDDKDVASIQQRIQAFNNETLPLLNFYKKRVIKINGNQSVEMVFEEIKNALN
jgi:adenylate kinase